MEFIKHKLKMRIPHHYALMGCLLGIMIGALYYYSASRQIISLSHDKSTLVASETDLKGKLASVSAELSALKSIDQIKRNNELEALIGQIEKTYTKTVLLYEKILDLRSKKQNTDALDKEYAQALTLLSKKDYAASDTTLASLSKKIEDANAKLAASFVIPENVKQVNAAPSSGFSRQQVNSDIGQYLVDVVAADLGSTRVIVDSASDSDCADNCPVLSLGDYVSRSGAFAGVNGSYFCPASYPSCAGKTNSFDTLLMNKNKHYLNSDNNVYSTVPAVIFLGGSVRYIGQSLEWGRDTGVDGVLANQPLLLSGGNIAFGGGSDPKQGSKGSRSFVGNKGSTVYIGVVYNATVAEVAHVLKTMGLEGALNLDSGGSTALWSSGYKVGPGRNIPNAILFVHK